MEYKRIYVNPLHGQENNIFVNKTKSQNAKSGLQETTTRRNVLGDICSNNTNIRQQQPSLIGKTQNFIEKDKKTAVANTRPLTRSYKNIQAKVDTRLPVKVSSLPNSAVNDNILSKPLRREESTVALASKAAGITARLRQTKISGTTLKKSSSKENLIPKEKKTTKVVCAKEETAPQKCPAKKLSENKTIKEIIEPKEAKDTKDVKIKEDCIIAKKESYSTELLDGVEDIDAGQENNPVLMAIYIKDIYFYLRQLETKYPIQQQHLDEHLYMTPKMRSMLIDWLVQVHTQFNLLLETLHMTVGIVDRYLQSTKSIERVKIQLVGITAMFIASKYEEMFPPDISDYVFITDNTYTKREILKCEKSILTTLDFSLGRPIPLHFVRRLIKAASVTSREHFLAKYLVDLSLVEYSMAHYKPSELASAAVCLSVSLLSPNTTPKNCWTPTLNFYSGYSYRCISPIVKKLAAILASVETSRYHAVTDKYSSSKHGKVAKYPELAAAANISI